MTRRGVMAATVLLATLGAGPAAGQQWELGGHLGAGTGLEGGDPGSGQTTFRRARTRVLVGLDARVDESPELAYGLIVFAEVEPHVGVGSELRLMRKFGERTTGFVGGIGVLAPHTLVGGAFGLQLHLPTDSESSSVFLEPAFAVLPLGTDLPGDKVIFWGMLTVGIHADL